LPRRGVRASPRVLNVQSLDDPMPLTYRDLTSLEDFAQVVELERAIWGPGYDEVVPVPILAVTVKRGGILVGAFDGDRMIGFVYSLPGIKHGRPTQWSHMLGVLDGFRNAGAGRELKLQQRERTLAMGLDLIEWTYDPMQAMNAHLNFARLGIVVEEYEENVYGESTSPLHRGNPTDRFVAEWWVRKPHVERRSGPGARLTLRAGELADAQPVNRVAASGGWLESVDVDLSLDARRLLVHIPMGFTDMLARNPELALAWRICTRAIFTTYFDRGYRAIDFMLDRASRRGAYLLVRA
jgi:predicted GNAT superfamily acetyltransferase